MHPNAPDTVDNEHAHAGPTSNLSVDSERETAAQCDTLKANQNMLEAGLLWLTKTKTTNIFVTWNKMYIFFNLFYFR